MTLKRRITSYDVKCIHNTSLAQETFRLPSSWLLSLQETLENYENKSKLLLESPPLTLLEHIKLPELEETVLRSMPEVEPVHDPFELSTSDRKFMFIVALFILFLIDRAFFLVFFVEKLLP